MRNPHNMELLSIYKFLSTVKENPNIIKSRIALKTTLSYCTIDMLKKTLIPAGFCKSTKANRMSTMISITPDGLNLLDYIERIFEYLI